MIVELTLREEKSYNESIVIPEILIPEIQVGVVKAGKGGML